MDQIQNTPRNTLAGLLADALQKGHEAVSDKRKTPLLGLLSDAIGVPDMAKTMDRVSYGEPLFTGKGMTAKPRPEAMNALMAVAPMAQAAPGLAKGANALGQAALRNALIPSNVPMQAQRGAIVYHGSPHTFDKFDMSKIGTGEGAQAYGHGLYFAENPATAQSYQTTLTADRGFSFGGKQGLTRQELQDLVNAREGPGYLDGVSRPSGVVDQLLDAKIYGASAASAKNAGLPRHYKPGSERAKLYEKLQAEIEHTDKGALYKVDLPDEHIAKMLDWDKPLSQQSPEVQKALATKYGADPAIGGALRNEYGGAKHYNGASLMSTLERLAGGRPQASEQLRQAGIPGIRYLDQGSRTGGAGTSNYVVFDDKLPKIVERNGKPLSEQLADLLKK